MADVRSLLRQQRAARRVEHPYAAYSDAGKLLCTLCREQIKTETLWDGHLTAEGHVRKVIAAQKQLEDQRAKDQEQGMEVQDGQRVVSQKRKLDDGEEEDEEMDDPMRRKRSRADIAVGTPDPNSSASSSFSKDQTRTPPTLARRTSTTPSQGIELQIPSRPATPAHRDGSSSSTSGAAVSTPAALASAVAKSLPSRQASTLLASATATATQPVDESEWAAFEAEIASAAILPAPFASDAVISAPAMSAEEHAAAAAAKANEQEAEPAEANLADDKEEAARHMEDEFDEMQELEARVRRLKEKREALAKKRAASHGQENAAPVKRLRGMDKENVEAGTVAEQGEGAVVEESSDEDEDDWDGFRFRTA